MFCGEGGGGNGDESAKKVISGAGPHVEAVEAAAYAQTHAHTYAHVQAHSHVPTAELSAGDQAILAAGGTFASKTDKV